MKKKIVAILAGFLLLFASNEAFAYGDVFKVGVKAGPNFMSFSQFEKGGDFAMMKSPRTGYTAGVAFSFMLPVPGMSIQPELHYVSKGAGFKGEGDFNLYNDYIEMPINIQAGLDLIFLRPFIMISPYIGYAVNRGDVTLPWENMNRFEYGIGVGAGLDIWKFQIQVSYRWNLGALLKEVPEGYPTLKQGNYRGVDLSLVIFF